MQDPELHQRIVREVAQERMKDGTLHVPPDDTAEDEDMAFWNEVERRMREARSG
jgi:hypothetical protein